MSDAKATILDADAELQPEAIERTLRDLWQSMVEQDADVTQVRMLNMLSYFPEPPSLDVRQAINAVAVQHPGRAIALFPDDQPPRAETTIACRTGGEKLRACGEQIMLHGSVNGEPVHSLALALLLGGLPITVWWYGEIDFADHIFHQLTATADHVILDSRTWQDPNAQLRSLAARLQSDRRHTWVSDLRWTALTSWRRIVAHTFDVAVARRALPEIGEITIEYGGEQHAILDAIYFAAWWMGRTGRVPLRMEHNRSEIVLRTRPAAGEQRPNLRIALRAVDSPPSLSRIELLGTGDQYVHVVFDGVPDKRAVRAVVENEERPIFEQVALLGEGDLTSLLHAELASVTPDPTFENSLQLASKGIELL